MNGYLARVIEEVKGKHGDEPEFVQTVEEVFSSLEPVIEQHPEYEAADLLSRMVEPERTFSFRVTWMADDGTWHTNTGYRTQFNGAIGPYKGGLRFRKDVNLGDHQVSGVRADVQERADGTAHRQREGRQRLRSHGEVGCGDHAVLPVVHDGAAPVHRAGRGRAGR
ncbi:hypothetical protein MM59RIKEN_03820 [Pusillibacter faecalis]|uniref:Glutamate/phenylalanine/leucine/valine/L-tryptophan dehydrogenase dimerisation domain-containing protein n=1 Tax=Pusillibacter faecalis TaxID=2714358 RepID=A0A810QES6_9FIRM|nr:hypothetical protein MM59RIKEN_03820 [Pusillibacter faecalis]